MPLLRSGVLCYTIAKPPEQFRCGETPIPQCAHWGLPLEGEARGPHPALRATFPVRGEGYGRWGATPYRCFAEPLRRGADPLQSKTPLFPGRVLPCFSYAVPYLRSSIPNQRVSKLCHATAPLCISGTVHCNSLAVLSRAFAGGESGRHKGLYSKVLRFADALPRLTLPMHGTTAALGFHATAPRSAIPEHHNADAICCFSYAVYFQAFAMPHQSHARPMHNYS